MLKRRTSILAERMVKGRGMKNSSKWEPYFHLFILLAHTNPSKILLKPNNHLNILAKIVIRPVLEI